MVPLPRTQLDAVVLSVILSAGLTVVEYLHHVVMTPHLLIVTTSFASLHSPLGFSSGPEHWRVSFSSSVDALEFYRRLDRKGRAVAKLYGVEQGGVVPALGVASSLSWQTDLVLANAALCPFPSTASQMGSDVPASSRSLVDPKVACSCSRCGVPCAYCLHARACCFHPCASCPQTACAKCLAKLKADVSPEVNAASLVRPASRVCPP
jgi:hypothetical protein